MFVAYLPTCHIPYAGHRASLSWRRGAAGGRGTGGGGQLDGGRGIIATHPLQRLPKGYAFNLRCIVVDAAALVVRLPMFEQLPEVLQVGLWYSLHVIVDSVRLTAKGSPLHQSPRMVVVRYVQTYIQYVRQCVQCVRFVVVF